MSFAASMITYVAFLRGINVGGNKKVPMAVLKKMLEKMGFKNVKTLLASGNAVFDAPDTDAAALGKKIEAQFQKTFGFTSSIILRTAAEIASLIKSDPFKGIAVTSAHRLYVTFLGGPHKSTLKIPYKDPTFDYRILKVTKTELISVLVVGEDRGTVDAMAIVEKEFGKNVTTRNWNTLVKIAAL